MSHWKSIHIERFRRLENLRLDDLGSVNLLVGKNNSGKTSVLEALAIASHPTDAFTWIDIGRERELKSARTPVLEVLNWFFPRLRPRENGFEGTASFSGEFTDGGSLSFKSGYKEFREVEMAPDTYEIGDSVDDESSEYAATLEVSLRQKRIDELVPEERTCVHEFSGRKFKESETGARVIACQFISPVSHRTSRHLLAGVDQVLEERLKAEVIRLLQKLAPDIEDIEIRSPQGRGAVIHLYHSKIGHVPLAVEGDGMRRALAFASASVQAKGGVLLLDEVETALHPEALAGVFRFLVEICHQQQVQLFVSTHSLEAVDAMLASVGDKVSDLVAYHLPPRDSEQTVYRLGGKSIRSMRSEGGLDLR
jgi:energy-coupling factor transporter ATP-binding protein EcfA2